MSQLSVLLCAVISWPWTQPWKVCGLCHSTRTTFNCCKTISISLVNFTELQLAETNKNSRTNIFCTQMLYGIRMVQNCFRRQQCYALLLRTGRTEERKPDFWTAIQLSAFMLYLENAYLSTQNNWLANAFHFPFWKHWASFSNWIYTCLLGLLSPPSPSSRDASLSPPITATVIFKLLYSYIIFHV